MPKTIKIDKLVPDTSVLIESLVSNKIKNKEISVKEVIIHEAVLAELEHQANQNKAIGYLGLDEIKRIKELATDFELKFSGQRPRASEIKYASLGEIDSMIRQLAYELEATLLTSDDVQSKVAEAKGMKVIYIAPKEVVQKLALDKFFDNQTMSVHLRENVEPFAKKGFPGNWEFIALRKEILEQQEIQDISREIIENTKIRRDGFIEIERPGSTIVQLGNYRIVITKPPFSDGWEITAVRPVKSLTLEDYKLSDKLKQRIAEQAEGVLIAGSPGMGKSTFAQGLSIHYASKDKVVKTVEAPRDLVLPENVTQYAISHGDAQEVHDILLLSRPDYTIFDEMRNTDDFKLFADLRLAGVGMVGVVHATNPVDAIQRFIGRVEMGVIPQIIDTVVFIKNGEVNKVLSLKMTVKVPSGMTEADLARPVVVINDFETDKLIYEIYSYGEQTVVVPVQEDIVKGGIHKLAEDGIAKEFLHYTDNIEVKCVSDNKCIVKVPEQFIAQIIGKEGKNINEIEKKIGLSIDVQELEVKAEESNKQRSNEVPYQTTDKKNTIMFDLGIKEQNKEVDLYIGNDFLLTAKAGITGVIKIKKKNPIGKQLINAIHSGKKIKLMV
jgi:ATPase